MDTMKKEGQLFLGYKDRMTLGLGLTWDPKVMKNLQVKTGEGVPGRGDSKMKHL